ETQILRGLTIAASDVTIRGLSLYGFTTAHDRPTEPTPPADIFITHAYEIDGSRTAFAVHSDGQELPNNILIEQNWLGLTPAGTVPETRSAFGVSVYNASGVTIRENLIGHHSGSGIITGARAENLTVTDNQIIYNGLAGMPDGIRLDGQVDNGLISNNLICGNDGSGIFLFKPQGAVDIIDNAILSNGQRLQRAAIYLMGNDHRVINNQIADQSGPGVVVTAFSQGNATHSRRNIITDNRFSNLDGLSIDLNTRRHRGVQDFQIGDGPNPPRNSVQRRRDTGNSAINAPEFASPEFYLLDGRVVLQGQADPGSTVQLYQTVGRTGDYGPLTEPLVTVVVDEFGSFEYATSELQSGDVVSAIATDPRYGTSEPALNAVVFSLGEQSDLPERTAPVADPAACLASPDFSDS
ncbi:MAG: right-handed parallel beta-helix repeat-containing protein, partial [Cyanobacteria bacterium P01_D01_bin.14]